jgi:hypothetical protein
MVPEGGRHASSNVHAVGQASIRLLSLLCRTRGDRSHAGPGLYDTRHRPPPRSGGVDDLPRVAPQRVDPQRWLGVPRDGGAMAFGAIGSSTQTGKAGAQSRVASVCAGALGRNDPSSERRRAHWSSGNLERASPWAATRSTMGTRVEPRADRPSLSARFPGRHDHADQSRGHLPGAVHPRSRCATPRVDRLPAKRPGSACSEGAHARVG